MENVQTRKRKMVWVDGNSLVRLVGEQEADEYLYRTGYQAKLTALIKERDRKLEEENNARLNKTKKVKVSETEPGLE